MTRPLLAIALLAAVMAAAWYALDYAGAQVIELNNREAAR